MNAAVAQSSTGHNAHGLSLFTSGEPWCAAHDDGASLAANHYFVFVIDITA